MKNFIYIVFLIYSSSIVAQQKEGTITIRKTLIEARIDQPVFAIVEEMPEYPGGNPALMDFIQNNLQYPDSGLTLNLQGTVYVNFVIDIDGSVRDVKVLRGIGYGFDEAAVNVVEKLSNFIPGQQRGKPVQVSFNLPIKFSLF